jgi:hypothetical protein
MRRRGWSVHQNARLAGGAARQKDVGRSIRIRSVEQEQVVDVLEWC